MEGIVEWWLLEQHIRRQTENVRWALKRLVADGLLCEKRGPDGRLHYRVNPEKIEEIRRQIAEEQS